MLEQFGHTAEVAENGKVGVEMFSRNRYDLILMDIQMPVMDGFEATAAIRTIEKKNGRRVPIIAVTAHVLPGYKEKCLAGGMDNYLPKPFKLHELKESIDQTLSQTNAPS